jgi:hypothetical protein
METTPLTGSKPRRFKPASVRERLAAEYGRAALTLTQAMNARSEAEGNASSLLWTALNADVLAAQAWANVAFAKLLDATPDHLRARTRIS